MVQLDDETSLEFAINILSTPFRERSNLMTLAMCLRYEWVCFINYDKVSANKSRSECSNLYLQLVHVLHS